MSSDEDGLRGTDFFMAPASLIPDNRALIAMLDDIMNRLDGDIFNIEVELPEELAVFTPRGPLGTDKDFPILTELWDLSGDLERMLNNLRGE